MKEEISIEDAMPGMLLIEDIRTSTGAALLPEGTELTEKYIEVLKSKGIKVIAVLQTRGESSKARRQAEIDRVTALFEPHKEMSAMVQLRDILLRDIGGVSENEHDEQSNTV